MSQFSAVGACDCDDVDNFIQPHCIAGKSWRNPVLSLANDEEMQNGNCRLPCLEHFERYSCTYHSRENRLLFLTYRFRHEKKRTQASHLSHDACVLLSFDKARCIEQSFPHRHFHAAQQNGERIMRLISLQHTGKLIIISASLRDHSRWMRACGVRPGMNQVE